MFNKGKSCDCGSTYMMPYSHVGLNNLTENLYRVPPETLTLP